MGSSISSGISSNGSSYLYNGNGSISSPSSTTSRSPPIDFMCEVGGNQPISPYGGLLSSSFMKRGTDVSPTDSSFSSFPLLTPSQTTAKGSMVLGNLFQPNKNSLGLMSNNHNGILCNPSPMSGFAGPTSDELMHLQSGPLTPVTSHPAGGPLTPVTSLRRCAENAAFPGQSNIEINVNGILSDDPTPGAARSSKSNESSGSEGSPTPRSCKVCEDAEVVAALVSCGHNHFCMECAEGIVNKASEADRKCPTCSKPATGVLRIRA